MMSPVARTIVVVVAALLVQCSAWKPPSATAIDGRVRASLDLLAVVIDPAYSFAIDACVSRQTLIVEEMEADKLTVEAGKLKLGKVRTACHATRRAFDAIRLHHDKAADFLASGDLERAEQRIQQIRAEWTELKQEVRDVSQE